MSGGVWSGERGSRPRGCGCPEVAAALRLGWELQLALSLSDHPGSAGDLGQEELGVSLWGG